MNCCNHTHSNRPNRSSIPPVMKCVIAGIFVAGGVYYLRESHRAHLFQYWPFAIFLLCPLMHLFHRHGRHTAPGEQQGGDPPDARR